MAPHWLNLAPAPLRSTLAMTRAATYQFPVIGVNKLLLGYKSARGDELGAAILLPARALAADKYGVPASDAHVSVQLRDDHVLDAATASMMTLKELHTQQAVYLVEPPKSAMLTIDTFHKLMDRFGQLDARYQQVLASNQVLGVQLDKINRTVYYPLCIRQLLILAAQKVGILAGGQHGPGAFPTRAATPPWAIKVIGMPGIHLQQADLDLIYSTTSGSVRGRGNVAAHEISMQDQAVAVRAQEEHEHASLSRVFFFVHGVQVSDA